MYVSAEQQGSEIIVWERRSPTKRTIVKYPAPFYFYVEDPEGEYNTLYGHTCSKLEFNDSRDMREAVRNCKNAGLKTFESDVTPVHKCLSEHYYGVPTPELNYTFYDIEVDYATMTYDKNHKVKVRETGTQDALEINVGQLRAFDGIDKLEVFDELTEIWVSAKKSRYNKTVSGFSGVANPYGPVNSVAFYNSWEDKTYLIAVPPETWGEDPFKWKEMLSEEVTNLAEVLLVETEAELLLLFLSHIKNTDALVGWNSAWYDSPYLKKRIERTLGKSYLNRFAFPQGRPPQLVEIERFKQAQETIRSSNLIHMDYLEIFRKFEMEERHSYSLEAISNELLDLPKLEYEGTLADLYRNDFNFFLRYNIRDTECLKGFEEKLGYAKLANEMFHSDTGVYNNVLGTIKLAELAIMNYCHHQMNNVIVPDTPPRPMFSEKAQGAFVLEPKAGFHKWIGSVDINSLYPSAIRTVNISPEVKIGQFTENVTDFEKFKENSNNEEATLLTTDRITDDPQLITKTVGEWKRWFKENEYSLSGYGTVFDQNKKGVIPSILESWFATRKLYKNKMKEAIAALEKEKQNKCDQAKLDKIQEKIDYFDRMQYCYKIKLNSTYGALLNENFKYFDRDLGESTTGTGRMILKFMCGKVNEFLTGRFDSEGEAVIYGDTDSVAGDSKIHWRTLEGDVTTTIEEMFSSGDIITDEVNNKEYSFIEGLRSASYNDKEQLDYHSVRWIYRHKTPKQMFKVTDTDGNELVVTGDHSLMVERDGKLIQIKAQNLDVENDVLVTCCE